MPTFRSSLVVTSLAAALLMGCAGDRPDTPKLSEAVPNLPLPPLATVVNREGGEDALQITFRSAMPPDSIAAFYRNLLNRGEWSLMNDARTPDGGVALYAERNGPPLWVTIRQDSLSRGTLITLAGAVTKSDSTAQDSAGQRTTPS